jgi:hypothetical protein
MKERPQSAVCERFGAVSSPPDPDSKVGIALATLASIPLNALRISPEGTTCGWYIWGGETMSQEADFFQPLHVHHLVHHCPAVIPYLSLPPGWRVLLAPGQEDVWHDPELFRA